MKKVTPKKTAASISIDLNDHEVRIERFLTGVAGESNQAVIHISARRKGVSQAEALNLSEKDLIELLHKAIHSGVLSQGFVGKLRETIEI